MELIRSIAAMQSYADQLRKQGETIAFVPTMGYLHEGHLVLVRWARARASKVVVSIFVNPTQFGPNEDFSRYPRNFEGDSRMLEGEGTDILFAPEVHDVYPPGFQSVIAVPQLAQGLCGKSRPTHFQGVATVVTKLFLAVKPHSAFFGQKDYQQLAIIKRLVRDLNFDIEVIGVPTVREPDGLAMSSRNSYLSPSERQSARILSQSLEKARQLISAGERQAAPILNDIAADIARIPGAVLDYATICHPETLLEVERIDGPVLLALAVKIGATRLIDNAVLTPEP
jgi:pantoate--beta-alanine ligase